MSPPLTGTNVQRDLQLIGHGLRLRLLDAAVAEVQAERPHLDARLA